MPEPKSPAVRANASKEAKAAQPAVATPPKTLSLDLLPRMLLQEGKVDRDAIKRAMLRQRETGEFIGDILVQEGLIEEDSLLTFLSRNCRIPHVSILNYVIDDSLFELVPPEICRKHRILPLDRLGRNLTVAMVNPLDGAAHQALRQCCPDYRIKPILCSSSHFETVSRRFLDPGQQKGTVPAYISQLSAGIASDAADAARGEASTQKTVHPAPTVHLDTASLPPLAADARVVLEQTGSLPPPDTAQEVLSSMFSPHDEENEEVGEDLACLAAEPESDPEDLDVTAQRLAHVLIHSMRNAYGVLARKLELLRGVPPQEIAQIFAMGKVHEYEPGQIIFEKGAPGESVFAILTGQVEVMDGDRRLALLSQGETVGEMALAEKRCRTATVRAVEQTALLKFTLEDIRCRFKPEVSMQLLLNVIVTLSARLHQLNQTGMTGVKNA